MIFDAIFLNVNYFFLIPGDKKRRDVVFSIVYNPSVDVYLVVSQKGVVSVWNSKVMQWTKKGFF